MPSSQILCKSNTVLKIKFFLKKELLYSGILYKTRIEYYENRMLTQKRAVRILKYRY